MMKKRILLVVTVLVVFLLVGCDTGSTEPETYKVGILQASDALTVAEGPIKQALADLGYTEGENIEYVYRNAKGNMTDLNSFAAELVSEKVDVLVPISTQAAVAAGEAVKGTDVPVIFYLIADPIQLGLVESYSQPGGQITGVMTGSEDTAGKRLEILQKIDPSIEKVLAVHSTNPVMQPEHEKLREAAPKLGLTLVERQIGSIEEATAAFQSIQPGEVDAIHIPADIVVAGAEAEIHALSVRDVIPNIYVGKKDTSLAAYGPDFGQGGAQIATLVDKILKGADPATLPVELPKKFNLIINLKIAEQIGLTLSEEVLSITDVLIE